MSGQNLLQRGTQNAKDRRNPEKARAIEVGGFGNLLGTKTVVSSSNSRYYAVDQFFFVELMRSCVAAIEFDEAWYLKTYQDIEEAVTAGTISSAHDHYIRFGYYEHRLPRKIEVDEAWYLSVHPDVQEAIIRGDYASGTEHFLLAGYREGRLPYAGFTL